MAFTRFYRSRSLWQGQRSNQVQTMTLHMEKILKVKVTAARSKVNQGHTMMLHTYNPKPMSLPSINFLDLMT